MAAPAPSPAAAAAPSNTTAVFMSPARAEVAECDICNEALESSEAAAGDGVADALRSRLPRLLPCGHSWCTGCIQKGLDANGGSVCNRSGSMAGQGGVAELHGRGR